MGAWSAKIFDDDGASDIRDEYRTLLGYGMSLEEAYKKIEDYFYPDYQGQFEEDVYWLAIALFQWQNGILLDTVKQRALECIDDESYLERWKDSGEKIYQERVKVLADLKYKLTNVVNEKRKRFAKPPKYMRFKTKWKKGDLLAYKVTEPMIEWEDSIKPQVRKRLIESQSRLRNRYILLRVINIAKMPISYICPELDYASSPVVMLYDWIGDTIPSSDEIDRIPFRPIVIDFWAKKKKIVASIDLEVKDSKEEKNFGEFIFLKEEKEYDFPKMYLEHQCSPIRVVAQFNLTLIQTFAHEKDEEAEWYSVEHFFDER